MAKPWNRGLPWIWFLVGCLLPDLIDKPLYYTLSYITGEHGNAVGLINGTRTFGHSAIVLALVALPLLWRSTIARALALGMVTHVLLDFAVDLIEGGDGTIQAFFFPFRGWHFSEAPFADIQGHLGRLIHKTPVVVGEAVGAWLFYRECKKNPLRWKRRGLENGA